jgi:hypothetical protein
VRVRLRPLELPTLDALAVDALAVFVGPDERPLRGLGGLLDWRLAGRLSQVLDDGLFAGDDAESLLMPTNGTVPAPRVFCFGTGSLDAADATSSGFTEVARRAATGLARAGVKSLALGLPHGPPARASARVLMESLAPLAGREITLLGDPADLALALPEWAKSRGE